MNAPAVLKLKNSVNGTPPDGFEVPNVLQVNLDAGSVDMLERMIRVQKSAGEIYGDTRVRQIELDFPLLALEYIQHHLAGPKTWRGNSAGWPRVVLYSDGFQFVTCPSGVDVTFESELVTYDRLARELRNWRARELGQSIEDAMADDGAPAPKKTSGMSPL